MKKRILLILILANSILAESQTHLTGVYNSNKRIFIPKDSLYSLAMIKESGNGSFVYKGKWGVLDSNGKVLLEPNYDKIELSDDGRFIYALKRDNQIYANYFTRLLISIDSLYAPKQLHWYNNFDEDIFKHRTAIVISNNLYSIVDLKNGSVKFGPTASKIKIVEPFGYLISGDAPAWYRILPHKRMYADTTSYAFYDSSMVRKTDYVLQDLEYRKRDKCFTSISKFGKGLLNFKGEQILPPIFDRTSFSNNTNYIFAAFNGISDIESHDGMGFSGKTNSEFQIYNADGTLFSKYTFFEIKGHIPQDDVFIVTCSGRYDIFTSRPDDKIVPAGLLGYVADKGMNLLSTKGNLLLPNHVSSIKFVKEGYYLVENNKENFIYNLKENKFIPIKFKYPDVPWGGFISAYTKPDSKGLITMDGTLWRNKTFSHIDFARNVAYINDNGNRFVIDENFRIIIPSGVYDSIVISPYRRFPDYIEVAKKVGTELKWGLLDKNYEILIPTKYQEIEIDDDPKFRFSVKQNGKWGILDSAGKLISACQFESCGFNDNFNKVGVRYKGIYSLLNSDGSLPESNGYVLDYDKNHTSTIGVNKLGQQNIINDLGSPILSYNPESIQYLGFGEYYLVKKNNKYGVVNGRGKFLIPTEWQSIDWNNAGFYIGQKDNVKYLIDYNGNIISSPPFDEIKQLIHGKPWIEYVYKSKHGIMSIDGKAILEPKFDFCYLAKPHVIGVEENNLFYFVDTFGTPITEKSNAPYTIRGSFWFSNQKPCGLVYDTLLNKLNLGCVKGLNQTNCANFYQVVYDSGIVCISPSGNALHHGYFKEVMEYTNPLEYGSSLRCADVWLIGKQETGSALMNKDFKAISNMYYSIVPDFRTKRCVTMNANRKYGLITFEGKEILSPSYTYLEYDRKCNCYQTSKESNGMIYQISMDGKISEVKEP